MSKRAMNLDSRLVPVHCFGIELGPSISRSLVKWSIFKILLPISKMDSNLEKSQNGHIESPGLFSRGPLWPRNESENIEIGTQVILKFSLPTLKFAAKSIIWAKKISRNHRRVRKVEECGY